MKTRFEMTQECLQDLKKGEQLAFAVDSNFGPQICLVRNVDGHPKYPLFNMRTIMLSGEPTWEILCYALEQRSREMDATESR